MVKVRVRLFSTLRAATGTEWLEADLPEDATVGDLLSDLEETAGLLAVTLGREYQWRHGSTSCLVVVNGRNIEGADWERKRLSPGDEVWLQPPVAGG